MTLPMHTFPSTTGVLSSAPAPLTPGEPYFYYNNEAPYTIADADQRNGWADNFAEILVAGGQNAQTGNLKLALDDLYSGPGGVYVPIAGGTMTGALGITLDAGPQLVITSAVGAYIRLEVASVDAGISHYMSGGDHIIALGTNGSPNMRLNLTTDDTAITGVLTVQGGSLTIGGGSPSRITIGSTEIKDGDFNNVLAASGYQQLPGGLLMQWGISPTIPTGSSTNSVTATFPIAFPTGCMVCVGNANNRANSGWEPVIITAQTITASSVLFRADTANTGQPIEDAVQVLYYAIGY